MTEEHLLAALGDIRSHDAKWVQIDVAAPGASASAIAEAVRALPELADSPRATAPKRWWFLRKPPGLRVRIEVPDDRVRWESAARSAFSALGPTSPGIYESERYRFGGLVGLDVAHDHFALDTAVTVRYERLDDPPDRHRWSRRLLGDLASRLVDDPAETWDAWKRLDESLARVSGDVPPERRMASDGDRVPWNADATGLWRMARQGNSMIARRLRSTALEHGVGPRSWFASVAVFHWDRMGFGMTDMQAVIDDALSGYDA